MGIFQLLLTLIIYHSLLSFKKYVFHVEQLIKNFGFFFLEKLSVNLKYITKWLSSKPCGQRR